MKGILGLISLKPLLLQMGKLKLREDKGTPTKGS